MNPLEWLADVHRRSCQKNTAVTLYVEISAALGICCVVAMALTGGRALSALFVRELADTFMDYFNSVVFGMGSPYDNPKVIYPPLITAFYMAVASCTTDYVVSAGGIFSVEMRNSEVPMLVFLLTLFLCFIVMQSVVSRYTEKTCGSCLSSILFFTLLLSFPVLWAIERGNSILYAVTALLLFISGYNSENVLVRIASYIALALAVGIKISPAVFVLLILRERRYAEFLICAGIIAFVFFSPLSITGGNLEMMFERIFAYYESSETIGELINITNLAMYLGFSRTVGSVLSLAVVLLTVLVVLKSEIDPWKNVLLLSCVCVQCFSLGIPYLALYLLPGFLLFLASNPEMNRGNAFYLAFFIAVFAMFPTPFDDYVIFASFKCMSILVITILLLAEGVVKIAPGLRRRPIQKSTGE